MRSASACPECGTLLHEACARELGHACPTLACEGAPVPPRAFTPPWWLALSPAYPMVALALMGVIAARTGDRFVLDLDRRIVVHDDDASCSERAAAKLVRARTCFTRGSRLETIAGEDDLRHAADLCRQARELVALGRARHEDARADLETAGCRGALDHEIELLARCVDGVLASRGPG